MFLFTKNVLLNLTKKMSVVCDDKVSKRFKIQFICTQHKIRQCSLVNSDFPNIPN